MCRTRKLLQFYNRPQKLNKTQKEWEWRWWSYLSWPSWALEFSKLPLERKCFPVNTTLTTETLVTLVTLQHPRWHSLHRNILNENGDTAPSTLPLALAQQIGRWLTLIVQQYPDWHGDCSQSSSHGDTGTVATSTVTLVTLQHPHWYFLHGNIHAATNIVPTTMFTPIPVVLTL